MDRDNFFAPRGRAASFDRTSSAGTNRQSSLPPFNLQDPDAPEPARQRSWWYNLQKACDKSMSLRTFMRFIPVIALIATSAALYFGIKNYLTLEASRATTILRQLGPLLTRAHADIQNSLAAIENKLNVTSVFTNGTAPTPRG